MRKNHAAAVFTLALVLTGCGTGGGGGAAQNSDCNDCVINPTVGAAAGTTAGALPAYGTTAGTSTGTLPAYGTSTGALPAYGADQAQFAIALSRSSASSGERVTATVSGSGVKNGVGYFLTDNGAEITRGITPTAGPDGLTVVFTFQAGSSGGEHDIAVCYNIGNNGSGHGSGPQATAVLTVTA